MKGRVRFSVPCYVVLHGYVGDYEVEVAKAKSEVARAIRGTIAYYEDGHGDLAVDAFNALLSSKAQHIVERAVQRRLTRTLKPETKAAAASLARQWSRGSWYASIEVYDDCDRDDDWRQIELPFGT